MKHTPLIMFLAALSIAIAGMPASAHPMGNFAISQYAAIHIGAGEVRLRYRLDIAELPSIQEMRALSPKGDGKIPDAAKEAYLAQKSAELVSKLTVKIDGQSVLLSVVGRDLRVRPGAADLATLLITVDCRGPLPAMSKESVLEYSDGNYPKRAGWKEVIATGEDGCTLVKSSVPATDLTGGLETYPADLIAVPPQLLAARVIFTPAPPGAASAHGALSSGSSSGSQSATPRDRLTQLMSSGFGILSLGVAFVLGCFHALAPGHGKTVVAAYLVGSRGTSRHALLLGAVVTLTHVAGVFALGFVVLFLSRYIVAEQLYPWLGFASGMTITLVGAQQFVQRYARKSAPVDYSHDPSRGGHTHDLPDRITPFSLIAMGVSGGMVPCPSALIVLLAAIAQKQIPFGLVLIVAFSLGLACVLIATGLLMLHARRALGRLRWPGKREGDRVENVWPIRYLPLASSAVVALLGVGIAFQSLNAAGIVQIRLTRATPVNPPR